MTFRLDSAVAVLRRTPATLDALLRDHADEWIHCNEGPDTFSPFDVVGHLVHGERTDWIPRARIILASGGVFEPFDRFAQSEASRGKTLNDLLDEFAELRRANLEELASLGIDDDHLTRTGQHPSFGTVTLAELLSTWVVHDLGHTRQIVRVMSKRYSKDVGPWSEYLPILAE